MTIKEFCKIYKIDESGIYKKIKRNEKKLEGHIQIVNGTMQLDDAAEELLKPKVSAIIMEMQNEIERREKEFALLQANSNIQIEEYIKMINEINEDMAESFKLLKETTEKFEQAEREKAELEEKYNAALDRMKELEQLAVSNGKRGGIFGRRS